MLPEGDDRDESGEQHTKRLAAQILLDGANVMHCAQYWAGQYCGGLQLDEREHFNALVRGLLREAPRLELVCNQGTSRHTAPLLRQHGVLRLVGDASHALPLEQLARGQMCDALHSLGRLMRPLEKGGGFLSCSADGLDGELRYSACAHDDWAQRLYEPWFLVLALYCVHVPALYHCTTAQSDQDWLPRHLYSLRAIDGDAEIGACGADEEKRARCRRELAALHADLETTDFEQTMAALQARWREKAEWCWQRAADELL
jgi:hypothetical protein